MSKMLCNEKVSKSFRKVAYTIVFGLIVSTIGITLSIYFMVLFMINPSMFPFSGHDPPYLGIICGITLVIFIVLIFPYKKIKKKVCPMTDIPML